MGEIVLRPLPKPPIPIPRWDDTLHLQPRVKPDKGQYWTTRTFLERAELWSTDRDIMDRHVKAAASVGMLPPKVTLDQTLEVIRRRNMQLEIQRSQVPEWQRHLVEIMTALDNVEDDISTARWTLRPILTRFPAGRELDQVLGAGSYVLDGTNEALRTATLMGRPRKRKIKDDRRPNARTRKGIMGKMQTGAEWIGDNWGHLIEAGQSADNHIGVGVSFGPIFGSLNEASSRIVQSAWHGTIAVIEAGIAATPGLSPELRDTYETERDYHVQQVIETGTPIVDYFKELVTEYPIETAIRVLPDLNPVRVYRRAERLATDVMEAAGNALNSISRMWSDNPMYTPGEHAMAALLAPHRLLLAGVAIADVAQKLPVEQILELDAPRPRVTDEVTRLMLEELGCRFDDLGRPLGVWAGPTRTARQLCEQRLDEFTRFHDAWLPEDPQGPDERFIHACVEACMPGAATMLTGDPSGIRDRFEPEVRAAMLMEELGEYPPADYTDAELAAWFDDQRTAEQLDPDAYGVDVWRLVDRDYWAVTRGVTAQQPREAGTET